MKIHGTAIGIALAALAAAAPAAAESQLDGAPASAPVAREMAADSLEPAPMPSGSVARAQFSTAVVDREPVDALRELSSDEPQVYFFTELRGFQGQELTHRWEHAGEVKAEVPIAVGGPRWRAYSSKSLGDSWTGTWTVSVVDASGRVVAKETLQVVAAPAVASEEPMDESMAGDDPDALLPPPAAPADLDY